MRSAPRFIAPDPRRPDVVSGHLGSDAISVFPTPTRSGPGDVFMAWWMLSSVAERRRRRSGYFAIPH